MKNLLLLSVILLLSTLAVADDIYKCIDDNGKTRFSQRPCGDSAEKIKVENSNSGIHLAPNEEQWDSVKYANKEREINRELEKRQETLNHLQAERDRIIAELQYRRQYAAKNIVGKKFKKQIDKEIRRTENEYRRKIQAEEKAIRGLKKELQTNWK